MNEQIAQLLTKTKTVPVFLNEPLSKYTYTKTGGPADVMFFPTSLEQLQQVVVAAQQAQLPLTVLGNASNLIVKDGGIRGVVVFLTRLHTVTHTNTTVTAQTGASIIDVARTAADAGLSGLEFAAGIPGSIGGAVYMNAGAYGGQVSDVLKSVEVVTPTGEMKTYTHAELNFGYRQSRIQSEDDIVVEATFELTPGDEREIKQKMWDLNFMRAAKQPLEYPSCGSVFKRPAGHYTGKLVHDAGLQGFQIGGAQVSTKHAGFIVNVGGATGSDYQKVIAHVQQVVWDKFQVKLETEVKIIGSD